MKLKTFLLEAERSMDLSPQKEDPKAKTTPMRQKLRKRDLGAQETVANIKGRVASNRQQAQQDMKDVAVAATGVEFGDKQDPVDRALDLTRAPAEYQRERAAEYKKGMTDANRTGTASEKRAAKEKIEKEFGGDPSKGLKGLTDKDNEYNKLSRKERMSRAVEAGKKVGRMDKQGEIEDAYKDARIAAEKPTMRDPIEAAGKTIYDSPNLRHGLQPSQLSMPAVPKEIKDFDKASSEEIVDYMDGQDNFVSALYNLNTDKVKASKRSDKADNSLRTGLDALPGKGEGEMSNVMTPSGRDLETYQKDVEDTRQGESYYTPEVKQKHDLLRKYTQSMDSAGIQNVAFGEKWNEKEGKYDERQISDEMLDKFLSQYGYTDVTTRNPTSKAKITKAMETAGIPASKGDRLLSMYGGENIFDGDVPEEFLPKTKVDGKWITDTKAPAGMYDMSALKKATKGNPTIKAAYDNALDNRGREVVRSYMRQGGVDAYAPHEGLRAMTDMDLEHIKSLNADALPGESEGGGYDHPDNWVWASSNLNQLRGNDPLPDRSKKYVAGQPGMDGKDLKQIGQSFDSMFSGLSDEQKEKAKNLKTISVSSRGKMSTNKGDFLKRSQEDIDSDRKELKDLGVSDKETKELVPDITLDPQSNVVGARSIIPGQSDRLSQKPFLTNPETYEGDVKTADRDEFMHNKAMAAIKKATGLPNEKEAIKSVEGEAYELQMRKSGRSDVINKNAPTAKKEPFIPDDIMSLGGGSEDEDFFDSLD